MFNGILLKEYALPPVNEKELLRYAGCKTPDAALKSLISECIAEAAGINGGVIKGRVCYRAFTVDELFSSLGDYAESKLVRLRFQDANYALAFAATVGIEFDRLVAKYSQIALTKSVLFQALGGERIESLCDVFQADVQAACAAKGYVANERFSAGYGDFSLQAQTWFFSALDCPRKIGLTLNSSLLMTPTKSVTGLIACKKR